MNSAQVFPEIALLARVESGQPDDGVFYKHEIFVHHLLYMELPPQINLGDTHFGELYAQESYTTATGQRIPGAPILFTITLPEVARHRDPALAFVRFVFTSQDLLRQFGFGNAEHRVGGDSNEVPAELRALTSGVFEP
jgi:molybdate/tungstate transport system substrate-binding protein